MRRLLLALSENKRFQKWFTKFPPSRKLVRRFVAGENLDNAIREIQLLNEQGIMATLDHLGEHVSTPQEAEASCEVYLDILDRIHESGINSNVSLKLTQMGLAIDNELCFKIMKQIVERAAQYNNFVRIDMEDSAVTDATLKIYKRLRESELDNVGVVIQAYLYRSLDDLQSLSPQGLNVRICKGAYAEPPAVAFPEKSKVDQNYVDLLDFLWKSDTQRNPIHTAIATHDQKIIERAKDLLEKHQIPQDKFEFQMLYGIRRDLQLSLANEGYGVRVYVSYGKEWYAYFMRRLAERPANLFFLMRNLFRR